MDWFRFELMETGVHLAQLTIAYALSLPIAWDRERSERSFGMRTFPLVAVASCSFMLLARNLAPDSPTGQTQVLYGVITGVSFLGAGIIIKQNRAVRGVATAAAVWTTTAVGAAVAQRDYGIAIAVSLLTFFTLRWLETFKLLGEERQQKQQAEQTNAE